jgi:hypothetical protein
VTPPAKEELLLPPLLLVIRIVMKTVQATLGTRPQTTSVEGMVIPETEGFQEIIAIIASAIMKRPLPTRSRYYPTNFSRWTPKSR